MPKTVLITGAAGNLGGFLARHLLTSDLRLRLMVHRTPLDYDVRGRENVRVVAADLARPETLAAACDGADCVVHFAGVLFAPQPERFLPVTNTVWAGNLVRAATASGVKRFVIVSFPHVEGPSGPGRRAEGRPEGRPVSAHARTRLAAEQALFRTCEGGAMEPVALRVGMVYARGVLMIDFARRLMERRLLGVWPEPTWIHLISLRDFLAAAESAVRGKDVRGIYNVGDDAPLTLQRFLDRAAAHWGVARPWRAPEFAFYLAAAGVEACASLFGTAAPLTRDFIRIGMVPYVMDTSRTRRELLPKLAYPTLDEGIVEL